MGVHHTCLPLGCNCQCGLERQRRAETCTRMITGTQQPWDTLHTPISLSLMVMLKSFSFSSSKRNVSLNTACARLRHNGAHCETVWHVGGYTLKTCIPVGATRLEEALAISCQHSWHQPLALCHVRTQSTSLMALQCLQPGHGRLMLDAW